MVHTSCLTPLLLALPPLYRFVRLDVPSPSHFALCNERQNVNFFFFTSLLKHTLSFLRLRPRMRALRKGAALHALRGQVCSGQNVKYIHWKNSPHGGFRHALYRKRPISHTCVLIKTEVAVLSRQTSQLRAELQNAELLSTYCNWRQRAFTVWCDHTG